MSAGPVTDTAELLTDLLHGPLGYPLPLQQRATDGEVFPGVFGTAYLLGLKP